MLTADGWQDYELIDTGDGEKLERWGPVRVIRPDPQVIWPRAGDEALWRDCHSRYCRARSGGGHWETLKQTPSQWQITYGALRFHIRPTDFKHMGLFPEQAVNWAWAMALIRGARRPIKVLNLFGYTGGATVACLSAGAEVTHVDAAKGMNQWAKDNITLSGLGDTAHRIIADDVMKFVKREARRGRRYDAIIMDPPSFGRGPSGELWKLEDLLFSLVEACVDILEDKPLFMLINAYTAGFSPTVAENMLRWLLRHKPGRITSGEIGLKATVGGLILPCGLFGRWETLSEDSLIER